MRGVPAAARVITCIIILALWTVTNKSPEALWGGFTLDANIFTIVVVLPSVHECSCVFLCHLPFSSEGTEGCV